MTQIRDQLQATLGAAYILERELGGGGMSRVFVAEETALRRKVAVKVLPPELTAGVNAERFKREILLAAKLQHPHIVPVLAAGETDGVPYYTMPFVEGESLHARLGLGDSSKASAMVARYDREVRDTAVLGLTQSERQTTLGFVALAEHRPRDAIKAFVEGDRAPDGPATACAACLELELGMAYGALHERDSTILHLERFVRQAMVGGL